MYAGQLVLNLLWSALFFGLGRRGVALVDIVLLDVAIVVSIALFWKVNRAAAAMLVPYLGWTPFATVLNFSVWSLNA
ncbi:TspO/MBR family protein [Mycolicibacterium mucogenicum]|uniref:Tryptophan-rich sensory protein n=1 Tax=Mycolicibacterium mucogenicum DSM 44124 TaxID=1226753 RepID=A0A8H2JIZ6_MYCMU|nr:peripheral-type benzodiazepine receptor [Mycolicibacterium mucogenicum DSM 44124]QPG69412.1 tryptophan-rich sensory protein [Mycolicibacterium mucogenicum DSM 44124]